MEARMSRPVSLMVVCAVLVCGVTATADEDPVGKQLAAAKAAYDKAAEMARADLLVALTKKQEAAQKAGDLKTLEKVLAEARAFGDGGELPKSVPVKGYESQVRAARTALEEAYRVAVTEYTKGGKISLAKAVEEELDEFRRGGRVVSAGGFFNGRDLSGWKGLPPLWSVRDGTIVGSSRPDGIKFNTCLVSNKQYADFELKCKVKLSGSEAANSGIQIRSQVVDAKQYKVVGAQCDIGQAYWGSLYGEGTGMMRQADKDVVAKALKGGDCNELYVRCVRRRVTIKLNGETTVDEVFPRLPARGVIGWQLHGGKGFEVVIRDIEFKELPSR